MGKYYQYKYDKYMYFMSDKVSPLVIPISTQSPFPILLTTLLSTENKICNGNIFYN